MPAEKSHNADIGGSNSIPASPIGDADAPGGNTARPQPGVPSEPSAPEGHKAVKTRRLLLGAGAILGLAIAAVFGVPWIKQILTTVSTDDAYVNGHVTFVAARVPGQVSRVLVDDNNRAHKGDFLAELDREPYKVAVAIRKAAVDTAKPDAATAMMGGIEARARSQRWKHGLLQSLFGYNALQAGLVMSPAGFFAVLTMPVVAGCSVGRQMHGG